MNIERGKGFPLTLAPECLKAIYRCRDWIVERYPDVEQRLNEYRIILKAGDIKSRHYDHEQKIELARTPWVNFYARACREIPKLKQWVGEYDREMVFPTNVIHEFTHAVQNIRGFHRGNETDTTLNELAWMKDNLPGIYKRCWAGKPPEDLTHATIERKRRKK